MRKKLLSFAALAAIVFLGACNNEEALPKQKLDFTFSASIMKDDPTTRVSLTEENDSIILRWEANDQMDIVITQGVNYAVGTATIQNNSITADGRKALFSTSFSGGSGTVNPLQPLNFYGVYGGQGLSAGNPINALLPQAPSASGSLNEVQDNEDVMLYFAHENITPADVETGVTLHHLGSLFKITVRNDCPTGTLSLENAQLVGINNSGADEWAYDFSTAGTVFDLTTQTFQNTGTGINSISFTLNTTTITTGQEATYWSWYPVLDENTWPELNLVLEDANPNGDLTTVNSKPARSTQIVAGRNYRFYAAFDGTEFYFTDANFVRNPQ